MTDYQATWAMFKRRNRVAILWLVLGLPALGALSVGAAVLFGTKTTAPAIMFVIMSIWSAIFLILGFRVTRLRCPRCGDVFFSHDGVLLMNTRCCGKCGLQLYSDEEDEAAEQPPA